MEEIWAVLCRLAHNEKELDESLPVTAPWASFMLPQGRCEHPSSKAICSLVSSAHCDPSLGWPAESCCVLLPGRKQFCTQACPPKHPQWPGHKNNSADQRYGSSVECLGFSEHHTTGEKSLQQLHKQKPYWKIKQVSSILMNHFCQENLNMTAIKPKQRSKHFC